MTSRAAVADRGGALLHWRRFSVPFECPVASPAGCSRRRPRSSPTSWRSASRRPATALVFLDAGVAAARRGLAARIAAHAKAHRERIELVAAPVEVPGGERIKTELAHIEGIRHAIHAHRVERHS